MALLSHPSLLYTYDMVVTGPRVPDNTLLPELAQRVVFNTPGLQTLLADSGYAAAGNSASAAALGLDLVSPPRVNNCTGIFPVKPRPGISVRSRVR